MGSGSGVSASVGAELNLDEGRSGGVDSGSCPAAAPRETPGREGRLLAPVLGGFRLGCASAEAKQTRLQTSASAVANIPFRMAKLPAEKVSAGIERFVMERILAWAERRRIGKRRQWKLASLLAKFGPKRIDVGERQAHFSQRTKSYTGVANTTKVFGRRCGSPKTCVKVRSPKLQVKIDMAKFHPPLVLSLLSSLLFSGCFIGNFNPGIPGSGKLTTVSIPAKEFDRVQNASVGALHIKVGAEESVSITTDDNLQQYLEAIVDNGELVFRTKGNENLAPTNGVKFEVTVKSLSGIQLTGVGSVTAEGIASDDLAVTLSGVGSMNLSGSAEKLTVITDGVGSFDSSKLEAKHVDVTARGVGSTKVKATESLKVKAKGIGGVTYVGQPREASIDASGIGKVTAGD